MVRLLIRGVGIVGLQACVFQLVKATQLSADKFTVSEIKAVKRVEKAWINGEIDSLPFVASTVH